MNKVKKSLEILLGITKKYKLNKESERIGRFIENIDTAMLDVPIIGHPDIDLSLLIHTFFGYGNLKLFNNNSTVPIVIQNCLPSSQGENVEIFYLSGKKEDMQPKEYSEHLKNDVVSLAAKNKIKKINIFIKNEKLAEFPRMRLFVMPYSALDTFFFEDELYIYTCPADILFEKHDSPDLIGSFLKCWLTEKSHAYLIITNRIGESLKDYGQVMEELRNAIGESALKRVFFDDNIKGDVSGLEKCFIEIQGNFNDLLYKSYIRKESNNFIYFLNKHIKKYNLELKSRNDLMNRIRVIIEDANEEIECFDRNIGLCAHYIISNVWNELLNKDDKTAEVISSEPPNWDEQLEKIVTEGIHKYFFKVCDEYEQCINSHIRNIQSLVKIDISAKNSKYAEKTPLENILPKLPKRLVETELKELETCWNNVIIECWNNVRAEKENELRRIKNKLKRYFSMEERKVSKKKNQIIIMKKDRAIVNNLYNDL